MGEGVKEDLCLSTSPLSVPWLLFSRGDLRVPSSTRHKSHQLGNPRGESFFPRAPEEVLGFTASSPAGCLVLAVPAQSHAPLEPGGGWLILTDYRLRRGTDAFLQEKRSGSSYQMGRRLGRPRQQTFPAVGHLLVAFGFSGFSKVRVLCRHSGANCDQ